MLHTSAKSAMFHEAPTLQYRAQGGGGKSEIEDFLKFSNFENCHSAHKSLCNLYSSKIIMFLDSFRVLIESFADSDSWMTPVEAPCALHISEIGLYPEAPALVL